jgi:uncharacterized protein YuzE
MIVCIGSHEFDDVLFDAERDVLYMHKGKPVPATETIPTQEGHAVMFNEEGEIIGITIVNAKWLAERDGQITVTVPAAAAVPGRLETPADALAPALAG